MIEWLEHIDRALFLKLNAAHSPLLDFLMWHVSKTYTWIPVLLALLYYAYRKKGIRLVVVLLGATAVSISITDVVSSKFLKETVQRYRPTHNTEIGHQVHTVTDSQGNEYRGGQFGFVSSHAANYAGMSLLFFLYFRGFSKKWRALFLIPLLIGYSRIYLGVHYPADIAAGAIIGFLTGYLVYKISRRLTGNWVSSARTRL